jgi:hypothetical protein
MARQSVLTRDPPPRLCVVLDESALHREVGGRDVLRRQVQRHGDWRTTLEWMASLAFDDDAIPQHAGERR